MKENVFQKLMHNIHDKMNKKSHDDSFVNEYVFNSSELDLLKKDNDKKLKELQETVSDKKKTKSDVFVNADDSELVFSSVNLNHKDEEEIEEATLEDLGEVEGEEFGSLNDDTNKDDISYVHLSLEHQDLIMKSWEEIDTNEIDRDIIDGKDLLNHNYTITYADEATKFIRDIRKKYEVVLCYLIGFNNEKKGIYHKIIFSNKDDNEWKYLSYYIKMLEKIRNFKMR